MSESVTITLGGQAYAVRPLTLRQLRVILPAFRRAGATDEAGVEASIDIIAAALSRDNPDLTAAALMDVESTVPELSAAVSAIARISGLAKADPAGEAQAGA